MRSTEVLLAEVTAHLAQRVEQLEADSVWASAESKGQLAREMEMALLGLGGIQINSIEIESRGVFVHFLDSATGERALLELEAPGSDGACAEPAPAPVCGNYAKGLRVIATMALPEAFAHKIAAALERDRVGDLYELSQLQALCSWDEATLASRLGEVSIDRAPPKALTLRQAGELLAQKLASLDQKRVEEELYPSLPDESRAGVLSLIRAGVTCIIDRLSSPRS